VVLTQPIHLFDLAEDLSLAEHQAVEASTHPQQVLDGFLVMERKQVRLKVGVSQAAVIGQKISNRLDTILRMAQQGVDLEAITSTQD
jgi:hypothetical protein